MTEIKLTYIFERSLGGFNDNPNVTQFHAAYRKLLGNDLVWTSKKGNCENDLGSNPFIDILYVSSRRDVYSHQQENDDIVPEEMEQFYYKLNDINRAIQNNLTDDLQPYMIGHVANLIERKILSTDNCEHCVKVLNTCPKLEKTFVSSKFTQKPCVSTYKICVEADRFLKLQLLKGNINFNIIYYSIINNIDIEQMFIEADFTLHQGHKFHLIRTIIDGYIQLKGIFMARTATEDLHTQLFRYKFRKLVHFFGQ